MKQFTKTPYTSAHKAIAYALASNAFGTLKKDHMSAVIAAMRSAGDVEAERAITDWQAGNLSAANQRLSNALIACGLREFAATDVGAFERSVASACLDLQAEAAAKLNAAVAAASQPTPTPSAPAPAKPAATKP